MGDNVEASEVEDLVNGKEDDIPEQQPSASKLEVEEADAAPKKGGILKTYEWLKSNFSNYRLPRRYRLVSEKEVLQKSIQSVRFTVMASAVRSMC